ncbi:hypothetical protein B7P43_G06000 [Cryptotermes secundus]|uniref:Targeting protein for Xklp2 n=1 Tax=Cryptotermes secundus TaxID=105785 RepID=A0A2J7QA48_9NEOP|nr:targeting protein for Xklp2 homolog [Cryptotermes secundus]PNF25470.1 hypothetical protein B7P43_G06000 [Cryptotermes secundus]
MDNFECKAPMYVNFGHSSAMDENDGADKFFDNLSDGQNEHQSDELRVESKEDLSESVDDVLNLAMKNLWTASAHITTPASSGNGAVPKMKVNRPSAPNLWNREYYHLKRKGSPMAENNQERKFISMAEAINRFQTTTPDRFHSKPITSKLNLSLQPRKGITVKGSTIPHSPNLRSHLRSRPVHYMTREEEEEKEAEEMKMCQIKASALNPKILKPPKLGIRVERKLPTVPVPFKLTEIVKKKTIVPPVYTFTAKPVPKALLRAPQGIPEKIDIPATVPVSPTCLKNSMVHATHLEVKDGRKCFTEKEVHHFGIPPARTTQWKRTTEVQPFSFEERDRLLLKKREETIQKYLEHEKKSREFHANPIPACVKSPSTVKEASVLSTEPAPFQLEVDKRGMIKKQQLRQKMEEEARKLQQAAQFKARPAIVLHKKPFEPKKSNNPFTDITAIELNTERRAKEREEFDTKIKLEQAELEELRRLRDETQKREEMEEIARLRKEAVHKANPIRRYKPLKILSSDKPLTDPQSPAFLSRSKTN